MADCICCSEPLGDSHQLVFDETGVELELQKLLEQCFELEVKKDEDKVQAVCDECLNELIETYDIQEKEVEEKAAEEQQDDGEEVGMDDIDLGDGVVFEADDDDYGTEVLEDDFSDSESLGEFVEEQIGIDDGNDEVKIEEGDELYENVVYLDEADQNFDFKAYKRTAINSNYNEIIFPIDVKCCICSDVLPSHKSAIDHIENVHAIEDFSYPCICDSTCEPFKNLADLSYHLVYKHYDLASLTIYNQCSLCSKRFSDFLSYNKHSCYVLKSVSRTTTTCEECKQVFRSNKRYRFHLQFHLESHRPMGCLICDTMFIDENEFFEHVHYGHERNIGFTCIRCDRTFSTEENLTNHKKIHKLARPYKCRLCSKSYLYSQLLKDHVIAHHSKKIPFQCHICGKYLFKQTHLNKHIMQHRMPEEKEVHNCNLCGLIGESEDDTIQHILHDHGDGEASIELITIDRALCCEYCELAFTSPEQLNKHRDLHIIKDFFCNMCPLYYDQYKKLKTHKLTHIDYVDKRKTFPVMRHYMCDVGDCVQSYMQWTSLRSHKRNKHSQRVLPCSKCSEVFRNPIRFNQHMLIVHGGAVHACPLCEKTFTSKMAIAVHVARKHNTTKVPCDECTNVFSNEFYLKRHKAAIHATYKCELCDRVLKNAKNLHVHHRVVHNKEKRFFCRYCNKGYYNHCDVLEHEERVHEKAKKYQCELCDYKAIYKQSLTIHMRAHNNETPYKCTLCTKGFRRTYALALHMKRHNNIRNFVCPYEGCGAAYPNQGILNSHLRSKHTNGVNVKQRKRRTIAVAQQVTSPNNEQRPRRRFDVPVSNIFVDDDDGLDDGVIGEPTNKEIPMETDGDISYETNDNPDDPVTYIITDVENPAVIVQRNESDHDYIVRPDDNKLYGNVIEDYDILYENTT